MIGELAARCDSEWPPVLIAIWLNQDGAVMKMKRCCVKCAVMGLCHRFTGLSLSLQSEPGTLNRPWAIPEGGKGCRAFQGKTLPRISAEDHSWGFQGYHPSPPGD